MTKGDTGMGCRFKMSYLVIYTKRVEVELLLDSNIVKTEKELIERREVDDGEIVASFKPSIIHFKKYVPEMSCLEAEYDYALVFESALGEMVDRGDIASIKRLEGSIKKTTQKIRCWPEPKVIEVVNPSSFESSGDLFLDLNDKDKYQNSVKTLNCSLGSVENEV